MFVVNEPPPQIGANVVALLRQAEPATIGHFRHVGFMDPGVRSLLSGQRIAGTAVTVRCFGPDTAIVHYALGKLRPGDVLVIDRAGDTRHAACGGGVAFAAREAGCVGIVIDGMATDIDELREYGLPVWARGLSTVTGKRLFLHGEFGTPVSCGGVAVAPGDAILADENGVLVMPPRGHQGRGGTRHWHAAGRESVACSDLKGRDAAGYQRHERADRGDTEAAGARDDRMNA